MLSLAICFHSSLYSKVNIARFIEILLFALSDFYANRSDTRFFSSVIYLVNIMVLNSRFLFANIFIKHRFLYCVFYLLTGKQRDAR